MNTIIKFIVVSAILLAVVSTIQLLIPDTFTSKIDTAVIYFLSQFNTLKPLAPKTIDAVYTSMKIIADVFIGALTYKFIWRVSAYFIL